MKVTTIGDEIFTVCACVYDAYGISKNEDVRSLASVHNTHISGRS